MGVPDYVAIFGEIDEDVATVDKYWVVTSCNTRFAAAFGGTPEQIVGKTPFELNSTFNKSIFFGPINETLTTGRAAQVLGYSKRTNRWLLIRTFPFQDGLVCFAHDASDLDSRNHQIAQLTRRDPLTSLENRHALEDTVAGRTAHGQPFSVIVLDLSRFKQINDTLGHGAGDRALMEFGARFKLAAPSNAAVYRLSGDEFAVLLDGPVQDAETLLPTLMAEAERPIVLDAQTFNLGASVGWVAFPKDGEDLSTLMRRADLAVFRSKASGNNNIAVRYSPQLEQDALNKIKLEAALRQALENNELSLEYQPKVSARDALPVGAEALLRWSHPEMGPIGPSEFLPLAEERGLMPLIDRWVINRAVTDISQLLRHGITLPIAINLSASALGDSSIPDLIAQLLLQHNVPARMLEIEITESDLMTDVSSSVSVLKDLHRLGVKVAIDDFGTGYSSFAYLLQLPVHALKIDKSFVSKMLDPSTRANREIVRGMISIAHSMKLIVVAEGVETQEQSSVLQKMHCDVVQGYFYSRPLKFRAFLAFIYRALVDARTVPDPYRM